MHQRAVGLDLQGAPQPVDGLIQLALFGKNNAQILLNLRIMRPDMQGLFQVFSCLR